MGQLLAILIIPPLVGVITYAVFRIIWEKDEQADRVAPSRPLDVKLRNAATVSACNRFTLLLSNSARNRLAACVEHV